MDDLNTRRRPFWRVVGWFMKKYCFFWCFLVFFGVFLCFFGVFCDAFHPKSVFFCMFCG